MSLPGPTERGRITRPFDKIASSGARFRAVPPLGSTANQPGAGKAKALGGLAPSARLGSTSMTSVRSVSSRQDYESALHALSTICRKWKSRSDARRVQICRHRDPLRQPDDAQAPNIIRERDKEPLVLGPPLPKEHPIPCPHPRSAAGTGYART